MIFDIRKKHLGIVALVGLLCGTFIALSITIPSKAISLPKEEIEEISIYESQDPEESDEEYVEDKTFSIKASARDITRGLQPSVHSLKKKENLWTILKKEHISATDGDKISREIDKIFNLRQLRPGHTFEIYKKEDKLIAIIFIQDKLNKIVVTSGENGTFSAYPIVIETTVQERIISADIDDTLLKVADRNGIPTFITYQFIGAFDGGVNFRRDLRNGDSFKVSYEEKLMPDGSSTGEGQINYAEITLSGKTYYRYYFTDKKGFGDFYDEKGNSAKRFLSVYPIGDVRITSNFGTRFHPVLKKNLTHWGIDFRAKIGTPVKAAGDGVITHIGTKGAYGKYVRIAHNSTYSTAYAHLNSFNSKLRIGSRVKKGQVIAYTGNTGRSTGPHLHFELIKGKRKVNPFKENAVIEKKLSPEEMFEFKKLVESYNLSRYASSGNENASEHTDSTVTKKP